MSAKTHERCGLGLLLALSILVNGCATARQHPNAASVAADSLAWPTLADSLVALSPDVDRGEATRLAAQAHAYARELAFDYHAVRPAVCQNVLVNLGLRKRGLCYHWAEDLDLRLQELQLRTLEIDWTVARPGTWREHNSLLVRARGQAFDQGIVLDAWRYAGKLHWGRVSNDRYPWQPVTGHPEPDEPGRLDGPPS